MDVFSVEKVGRDVVYSVCSSRTKYHKFACLLD